ncbi:hypothetical protein K438DRAFT_1885074 [Mycena galopus ATCC 62051]|nr:hypothetical protein K438DRAFT_1885074 [Mycena galopus ATCC 62051]
MSRLHHGIMEEVHDFLSKIPGLAESVGMEKAMAFIQRAACLKDEIKYFGPEIHIIG